MGTVDISVLVLYLLGVLSIGIALRRKAGQDLDSYFLGSRRIKWWALGLSGMASNLDVTGTMVIISFFYIIGIKGFLVAIRGGLVLTMPFLMIFMGKWLRRSRVMTNAEWMILRFGNGPDGQAARLLSAIATIVGTIGMVAYFAVGTGKFLSLFLPFPPRVCALIMITVGLAYTTLGGLYGVVYTDVAQAALIAFATIFLSVRAFFAIGASDFAARLPQGWLELSVPWKIQMPTGYEIYNLFALTILFFSFKTFLEGLSGPGGYMAQRYYAADSDKDAGRLSALWIVMLTFRWPFIMAVAALAFLLPTPLADPEMALPTVLTQLVPIGLKGLLLAGLMAASMSTFDSTINAGAAYLVKDVYQAFIKPQASEKELVRVSYLSTILIVVVALALAYFTPSINAIWRWLTMSLAAGVFLPNVLRWYWWRFNGAGYAIGTGVGMVAAIVERIIWPNHSDWLSFLIVSAVAALGLVVATLAWPASPDSALDEFYRRVRPFGWWRPVQQRLGVRSGNADLGRDSIALLLAIVWHLTLFLVPIFAVLHLWGESITAGVLLVLSSFGLYHVWYKHLDKGVEGETA